MDHRVWVAGAILLSLAGIQRIPADTVNYTYDDAGRLTRVQYSSGKTIAYSYDKAGNLLRRLVTGASQPGPTPAATAAGVVNAASFLGGAVAAGEIVTVFGTGIGRASLVGLRLTRAGIVDHFLADVQVLFDNVPSPLVYANPLAYVDPLGLNGEDAMGVVETALELGKTAEEGKEDGPMAAIQGGFQAGVGVFKAAEVYLTSAARGLAIQAESGLSRTVNSLQTLQQSQAFQQRADQYGLAGKVLSVALEAVKEGVGARKEGATIPQACFLAVAAGGVEVLEDSTLGKVLVVGFVVKEGWDRLGGNHLLLAGPRAGVALLNDRYAQSEVRIYESGLAATDEIFSLNCGERGALGSVGWVLGSLVFDPAEDYVPKRSATVVTPK